MHTFCIALLRGKPNDTVLDNSQHVLFLATAYVKLVGRISDSLC